MHVNIDILKYVAIETRGVLPGVSHSGGWEFEPSKIAIDSLIGSFDALLDFLKIPCASED